MAKNVGTLRLVYANNLYASITRVSLSPTNSLCKSRAFVVTV